MNQKYRKRIVVVENIGEAERVAHSLIKSADVSLPICCCALCVLGYSDEGDYLEKRRPSWLMQTTGKTVINSSTLYQATLTDLQPHRDSPCLSSTV